MARYQFGGTAADLGVTVSAGNSLLTTPNTYLRFWTTRANGTGSEHTDFLDESSVAILAGAWRTESTGEFPLFSAPDGVTAMWVGNATDTSKRIRVFAHPDQVIAGLNTGGAGTKPTAEKTTSYTAVAGDFIPVDLTSGNATIALPNAPADNTQVAVQVVAVSTGVVGAFTATINRAGTDTFKRTSGPTSLAMTSLEHTLVLQYKSSTKVWYIVSGARATATDTAINAAAYAPLGVNDAYFAAGTTASAGTRISVLQSSGTDTIGYYSRNANTGSTTVNRALFQGNDVGSYDTSAAPAFAYGVRIASTAFRSAGANPLTLYGIYMDMSGADVSYSFFGAAGLLHNAGAADFGSTLKALGAVTFGAGTDTSSIGSTPQLFIQGAGNQLLAERDTANHIEVDLLTSSSAGGFGKLVTSTAHPLQIGASGGAAIKIDTSNNVEALNAVTLDATLAVLGNATLGDAQTDTTTIWGNLNGAGGTPTLSANCNGSGTATIVGTNLGGTVTLGATGSITTCTVNWVATRPHTPYCQITHVATKATPDSAEITAQSAAATTFGFASSWSGDAFNYSCPF